MVGRFVEQQQFRVRQQQLGQGQSIFLATGKVSARLIEQFALKIRLPAARLRARPVAVAAFQFEFMLEVRIAIQNGCSGCGAMRCSSSRISSSMPRR